MNIAARLYDIFLLLVFVGGFIVGIPESYKLGLVGVLGAFMVPVVVAVPTVSALLAIGKVKPRIATFSLIVNKICLFIVAAIVVGFILTSFTKAQLIPLMVGFTACLFAVCFVLNIVALQLQRKKRALAGA